MQRTGSRDPWDKGGSLHWEVSKPDLIQGRPPALEFLSGRKSGWAAAGKGHLSPVSGVHGSLFTPEKWSMNQGQELQTETQTGPQGRLKFRAMQLSRHSTILNPLERIRHWAVARPPFHCICPALCPSLSLFRPLHLFFPPPSLCPRFLISDLSSNVICPERPTSPPQPECLLSPPSHMAAGHSPALVLSSWHVWYLK